MHENAVFEDLSDAELLTLVIYGEARGEPPVGKLAVAHVILNRVAHPCWWGDSIKSVILKPKQFSCFNSSDPNRGLLLRATHTSYYDPSSLTVAQLALAGHTTDPTDGATHYCALSCRPAWERDMEFVVRINRHRFFRERSRGD